MPAMTNRIDGTPIRRIAEFLALPTTSENCCVPSPLSPISGPIARQAANGMRFCVRAIHALVACSYGRRRGRMFVGWQLPKMRPEQSPRLADSFGTSAIPPVFSLHFLGHSLGVFPAPHHPTTQRPRVGDPDSAGTARLCFTSCGAWVSRNGKMVAPQPVPYGFRFPENLLCKERKKHFPDPPKKRRLPLGAGHLTSLRARVSRCSSGQKPTWRKSSWHSTKIASA